MKGIYQYRDLETDDVVYIGRDSNIGINKRHIAHLSPSAYNKQPFNRVIQNNPNRYKYEVICQYDDLSDDELNYLEIKEILKHKFLYDEIPKFNYTIGGDGISGYRHTDETKRKMAENNARYWKGKTRSEETRKKISEANSGENNYMYGNKQSDETKNKRSESLTKNYARIIKKGIKNGKQYYGIRFKGKTIKYSINKDKLIKWFKENYPNEKLEVKI